MESDWPKRKTFETSPAEKAAANELKFRKQAYEEMNRRLKERGELTLKDFQIDQAAAKLELANNQARQAALKAYNAELQMEGALKARNRAIKRGAEATEVLALA